MRRSAIFAFVCVMMALGLIIWGFSTSGAAQPNGQIKGALLLVEDDTGTYLMQLRKGLQEAVQERGGTLHLERLGDHGANGHGDISAIYLLSDDPMAHLPRLREEGLPIIVLGHELRGEMCILSDEEGGGRLLGSHLFGHDEKAQVLILGDAEESRQALRLQGIVAGHPGLNYSLTQPANARPEDLERADALIALSDEALDVALSLRGQSALPLFGFDAADTRLALMESGKLSGVVADDPYALGYIAGSMLDDASDASTKPFLRLSPRRLVTRDTMYDAAHVKLIFPLLH